MNAETLPALAGQVEPSVRPRAWLLTGGRLYEDSVMRSFEHATERARERKDGTRLEPLYMLPDGDATFEVMAGTDDEMDFVAGTSGPRDQALREALQYANQYARDGAVKIFEVLRVPVVMDAWPNVRAKPGATVLRCDSA